MEKQEPKYIPEFVQQILDGAKQIEDGNGFEIAIEDLWKEDSIEKTQKHE